MPLVSVYVDSIELSSLDFWAIVTDAHEPVIGLLHIIDVGDAQKRNQVAHDVVAHQVTKICPQLI